MSKCSNNAYVCAPTMYNCVEMRRQLLQQNIEMWDYCTGIVVALIQTMHRKLYRIVYQ